MICSLANSWQELVRGTEKIGYGKKAYEECWYHTK